MRALSLVIAMAFWNSNGFAQGNTTLAEYFEGRQVNVKIDMPATKDGVDIRPNSSEPLKFSEYATRLKQHGIGVRSGEKAMITKLKVKPDHIELQLGSGGFGTVWDLVQTVVVAPPVPKSKREKNTERDLKNATDPETRKTLQAKSDRLEQDRRRDERLLQTLAAGQRDAKRAEAEERARETGSRLNIYLPQPINEADLTPDALKQMLAAYLEFE
jgi:hypothetical protein